ncbi:MAG: hypothetical protein K2V71_00250 [Methylotenera sp.]|nr:hypothetical protein [Methylotenera sp.]
MEWGTLFSISNYFPDSDQSTTEIKYKATKELFLNAINMLKKDASESYDIRKSIVAKINLRFPEFNEQIISRYLHRATTNSFSSSSDDDEINNQTLYSIGVFSAAALIDKRANFRPLTNSRCKLPVDDDYVFIVFPHLIGDHSQIEKINDKINQLVQFCSEMDIELRSQINQNLVNNKAAFISNNSGFSNKAYDLVWEWAQARNISNGNNFQLKIDSFIQEQSNVTPKQ